MNVLEVNNVRKRLGKRDIIKGISFNVKEGEILGFLGPNGAGKTTTIRMLVGLITPNKGTIKIMGYDVQKNRELALREVGAVVENPELYTYLSGRENLMQLARMYENITKEDVDEIVSLVGLTDRINDKVKKYSLGMKQRLGLAEALLTKPKLLILDEPTNGLDPSGIIEFRNIIKKMAKENNMSVFVSSHILSEIQQLCDTVAFINDGVIKSVESVNSDIIKQDVETIIISSKDMSKCSEAFKSIHSIHEVKLENNCFSLIIDKDTTSEIISQLSKMEVPIEEVFKKQLGLEERYMKIVETE